MSAKFEADSLFRIWGRGLVLAGWVLEGRRSVVAFRLPEEEKLLLANLKGYEAYRQKVRYRLVPYVW
jgi:protein-S-isoprenylcysteine O-methyltransferase Ste14